MNRQRLLTSVLALVLALSLAAGLSQAAGPSPSPYQGEGRVGVGLAPLGTAASAPLSTGFTYQGQLMQSGSPVNGTCDFRFSLWDAASLGTQIGSTQTILGVTVSNGLFTVQLDFGASAFSGDARWLEIAARYPAGSGSYTTLTPRQPLTAAPYALYALSNWSLTGNSGTTPGSNFLGTTDNQALELRVNNARALRLEPHATSPNLIGGYSGNSVTAGVYGATIGGGGASGSANSVTANYGTVGGGRGNTASGTYATIGGGNSNAASGLDSTIGGGYNNLVTATYGIIGGGYSNLITATYGTIGGGSNNTASHTYATVGGGYQGTASGYAATIGGGYQNTASNSYATVGGGSGNVASGNSATISGGFDNIVTNTYGSVGGGYSNEISGYAATIVGGFNSTASGYAATVGGGYGNTAAGEYSFAAGRRAKANHVGAFVWGDSSNTDITSTANDQFLIRASGGVVFTATSGALLRLQPDVTSPNLIGGYSGNSVTPGVHGATIGGGGQSGDTNLVTDHFGTVGGGSQNQAGSADATLTNATYATVGGGWDNTARALGATVGGGEQNIAGGVNATIGGGWHNIASGGNSTVGGGSYNYAYGNSATISGGEGNTANDDWVTIGGGQYNSASGDYTTIAGGHLNAITGNYATIGGGYRNRTNAITATIGGGEYISVTGKAATVAGGSWITATGNYATVGGGWHNKASGYGATVSGGGMPLYAPGGAEALGNIASGDLSTVGGGSLNTASGDYATVGGGYVNTASGDYSTVPGGSGAAASRYGQMAYANGIFADLGDAQTSLYVLRNTTTDATPKDLFLDGLSQRLTIATDRTLTFDILVVARSSGGASAGYHIQGVIENTGGTTDFVGPAPVATVLAEDIPAWGVVVVADNANDALVIRVTGSATTVRWVATIRTAEVAW